MIKIGDYLTGSSIKEVDEIYELMEGYAQSLGHNVEVFEHLISQLETGYDLGSEDFINQLCYRELFDKILAMAPPSAAAGLSAILGLLDDRFNRATQPSAVHTPWFKFFGGKSWADRVPKNYKTPELKDYLVMRGCIK